MMNYKSRASLLNLLEKEEKLKMSGTTWLKQSLINQYNPPSRGFFFRGLSIY